MIRRSLQRPTYRNMPSVLQLTRSKRHTPPICDIVHRSRDQFRAESWWVILSFCVAPVQTTRSGAGTFGCVVDTGKLSRKGVVWVRNGLASDHRVIVIVNSVCSPANVMQYSELDLGRAGVSTSLVSHIQNGCRYKSTSMAFSVENSNYGGFDTGGHLDVRAHFLIPRYK